MTTIRSDGAHIVAPPTKLKDEDLEELLRIRHFETTLLDLFSKGEIHGTTHTCLGQEYVPVSLRPLLRDDDFVFSNHRGHGHYLARFGDVPGLLAEITGRQGAVCGGVGGSQHVYRRRSFLSTGVQGESLPVAAGVAFDLKRRGTRGVALVYVGDGTWGEGAVYEGLNMASLWQLPVVVIVENNRIAQTTPTALQMAGTIEGRARAFGIEYRRIQGREIGDIRAVLAPALLDVRERNAPLVVEFETFRLGPHSKGDDTRSAEEIEQASRDDLIVRYESAYPDQFAATSAKVGQEVSSAVREVLSRPPCGSSAA